MLSVHKVSKDLCYCSLHATCSPYQEYQNAPQLGNYVMFEIVSRALTCLEDMKELGNIHPGNNEYVLCGGSDKMLVQFKFNSMME